MNIHRILILLFSLLTFLTGSAFSTVEQSVSETAGIKIAKNTHQQFARAKQGVPFQTHQVSLGSILFKDAHHGFTVEFPETWEVEQGFEDKQLDFVVVALSPEEGPEDRFVENMNILVEEVKEGVKLHDYFMWNLMGLMEELPEFQLLEKRNMKINGVPMSRVTYSWEMNGVQTITYQYIFVHKGKGYVLTFSSEPGKFRQYKEIFDSIARSFRFE